MFDPRPNIIVLVSDDLPSLDGRIVAHLPNIRNHFVDQGVTFGDFHSENPLCCPARASFYTGLHSHNTGVTVNEAALFDPSMTIFTALHAIGYRTMLYGKSLNMYDAENCVATTPPRPACAPNVWPGFDDFKTFGDPNYYSYRWWDNGVESTFGATDTCTTAQARSAGGCPAGTSDYSTDVVANVTIQGIDATPMGQPFIAWVATFAPHVGTKPAYRYKRAKGAPECNGIANWTPPSYNEADLSDKPSWMQNKGLLGAPVNLAQECRSMLATDDMIGRIVQDITNRGQLDTTLFVLMGDNGMDQGEHRLVGKNSPYGTLMPFYIWWPGALGNAPRRLDDPIQNIDFAPTICELVGCTLGPYPDGQAAPDGQSFASTLFDGTSMGRAEVFDEHPSNMGGPVWYAVRTTAESPYAGVGCAAAATGGCRWKYVEYPKTHEVELYDDSNGPCWLWTTGAPGDPCELSNLLVPSTGAVVADNASLAGDDPSAIGPMVTQLHADLTPMRTARIYKAYG